MSLQMILQALMQISEVFSALARRWACTGYLASILWIPKQCLKCLSLWYRSLQHHSCPKRIPIIIWMLEEKWRKRELDSHRTMSQYRRWGCSRADAGSLWRSALGLAPLSGRMRVREALSLERRDICPECLLLWLLESVMMQIVFLVSLRVRFVQLKCMK
jgi:hypothetical protein